MPLAEVVSTTGESLTPAGSARWIDMTVRLYREHGPCRAILVLGQESACTPARPRAGRPTALAGLDDDLAIPSPGLTCRVGDLDRDTHWPPRGVRTRRT
ncbi:hypothetical protein LRS73_10390 [Methylobacterium currus]|uniref:hypothetical protein n=1 Tax=Methylobacterium currus TaxID=2051553 RepID=UPI001E46C42C|nr:hypothetical protein [Methylobacterium currus]UHC18209.1 hypothetical protein LRS73_10390 [Methylobacterium currus]